MRVLGLDVGDKRIGVALSDPMAWTAQGHSVLERGKEDIFTRIAGLCRELEVNLIVVGWPLNMNGSIGPRATGVQEFAQKLEQVTGLPVELWDERLSTKSAERVLLEADLSRKRRKKVIDKMAAVMILQSYLDNKGRFDKGR